MIDRHLFCLEYYSSELSVLPYARACQANSISMQQGGRLSGSNALATENLHRALKGGRVVSTLFDRTLATASKACKAMQPANSKSPRHVAISSLR